MAHPIKYVESNVPSQLKACVVHLHEGRLSKNQLKKIGQTNTRYVTICKLRDKQGNVVAEGKASCSTVDNPSRKIGRAVAIGRALAEYYTPTPRFNDANEWLTVRSS